MVIIKIPTKNLKYNLGIYLISPYPINISLVSSCNYSGIDFLYCVKEFTNYTVLVYDLYFFYGSVWTVLIPYQYRSF